MIKSYLARLDKHLLEVLHGASIAFVLKIIGALLAFAFNVALARLLGTNDTGIYFLSLMIITIAVIIGRLGLENTLVRFVAREASQEAWGKVKGVFLQAVLLMLTVSIPLAVIVALASGWIATDVFEKPNLADTILLMSFAIVPFSLFHLFAQALRGLKKILKSQFLLVIGMPLIGIGGLLLFVPPLGISGAVIAFDLSAIVLSVVGCFWWLKETRNHVGGTVLYPRRTLLDSSLPLLWVDAINLIIGWMATFLLGIWGSAEDVGVFSVAFRVAITLSFVLKAMNSISAPKYSELYTKGDLAGVRNIYDKSVRIIAVFSVPLFLIVIIFSEYIMSIFGDEYIKGAAILAVLAVGQAVNVIAGSSGVLLMMTGHEKAVRNIVTVSVVFLCVMCFYMIPAFQTLGAAIAVATTMALRNIMTLYVIGKKHGVGLFLMLHKKQHTS